MSLYIKDVYATTLVAISTGLYFAQTKGINIPLIGNNRTFSLCLLVLGMTICAVGAGNAVWPIPKSNLLLQLSAGLGFLGFALCVLGIVTGNKIFTQLVVGEIILLWVITTTRHFLQ